MKYRIKGSNQRVDILEQMSSTYSLCLFKLDNPTRAGKIAAVQVVRNDKLIKEKSTSNG
jgi:hypothetical protein